MTDRQVIDAIVELRESIPQFLTGTVVSDDPTDTQLIVTVDSDPSGARVLPNANLVGGLARNTRVLMVRQSPSWLIVLGITANPPTP